MRCPGTRLGGGGAHTGQCHEGLCEVPWDPARGGTHWAGSGEGGGELGHGNVGPQPETVLRVGTSERNNSSLILFYLHCTVDERNREKNR